MPEPRQLPDPLSDAIAARFAAPRLLTSRPVGGPLDLALLVEEHREGTRGRVWSAGEAPQGPLSFPVGRDAMLTVDGGWVVDIDDGGGSEVGRLVARAVDGEELVDLIPGREPFVLRGLDASSDGSAVVATIVDEAGFHVAFIPAAPWGAAQVVFSTPAEAWYGKLSHDARLIAIDTTDHNPGVRRTAVTVVEADSGEVVAVLDDLPSGPVRCVRFSSVEGDERLLASTERTGFARPLIWNPLTGARTDFELAELRGEVLPLDWHAPSGRVLAVHIEDGIHRLVLVGADGASVEVVAAGGSFADPDVADPNPFQWASYLSPDGEVRAVRSSWDTPVHVSAVGDDGRSEVLIAPSDVPAGVALEAAMVESADGTRVQVWLGRPTGVVLGTVLEVHGGPNLVAVDAYDPSAQAWMEAGFAYASLNYRGSVSFGRDFREGFWGSGGDRELEDVAAAVDWLRAQGLADPASTFMTGASFGGHLTLLSLGRLPGCFAGGFAHVAVADWAAAIAGMNPAVRSVWTSWVPAEMVERFSAVTYVGDVRARVWINQGVLDTRTPVAGVSRFVDELAAAGGDVVLQVFDGGHEPAGLEGLERDQRSMTELALRALDGRRWADPEAVGNADATAPKH